MTTARTNRQTYVANRLDVTFNGAPSSAVGAIQNANLSVSFGLDEVSGIGSDLVIEHVPTLARVSVSADQTYLFNHEIDAVKSGLSGQAGILPASGEEALFGVIFDIAANVKDKQASEYGTLWLAQGCFLDSGDFSAAKHGTVGRRCQFKALNYQILTALTKGATGA